ncbi:MAG: sulfotransferase [Chloroflexota bacterium]
MSIDNQLNSLIQTITDEYTIRNDNFPIRDPQNTARLDVLVNDFIDLISASISDDWQADKTIVQNAKNIINKPLFVCGTMRSGSTMLVELLDSHPNLVVLPGDTHYINNVNRNFTSWGQDETSIRRHWLRRFMNPKGQHPFWTLGEKPDLYIEFSQYLTYWYQQLPSTPQGNFQSVILAFYCSNPSRVPHPNFWISKTPGDELYIEQILEHFPTARFIHILRNPGDTVASWYKLAQHRGWDTTAHNLAQYVAQSYDAAIMNKERYQHTYHLVKYEDILEQPNITLENLLRFINVPFDDKVLVPTINGKHTSANSQYKSIISSGEIIQREPNTWIEKLGTEAYLIDLETRSLAEKLGYDWKTTPAISEQLSNHRQKQTKPSPIKQFLKRFKR